MRSCEPTLQSQNGLVSATYQGGGGGLQGREWGPLFYINSPSGNWPICEVAYGAAGNVDNFLMPCY